MYGARRKRVPTPHARTTPLSEQHKVLLRSNFGILVLFSQEGGGGGLEIGERVNQTRKHGTNQSMESCQWVKSVDEVKWIVLGYTCGYVGLIVRHIFGDWSHVETCNLLWSGTPLCYMWMQ